MPTPRQEAALEELRKALRKVLAYEPSSKPQKTLQQEAKYRRSTKQKAETPSC